MDFQEDSRFLQDSLLKEEKNRTLSDFSWFIQYMDQPYQDCAQDKPFCEFLIDFTYYCLYGGIFIHISIVYYFSYAYRQYKHKCKMNEKFAITEQQNKVYTRFANQKGIHITHMNDPNRTNLNLDRAAILLKAMKKNHPQQNTSDDEENKRGHLDSYFIFEADKSIKIVDLTEKGRFLLKN